MNDFPPSLPTAKPKSLLVFGILNLLFAAMGVMGIVSSLLIVLNPALQAANPVVDLMNTNPTYATYYKIILVPGILALIALTASAIGLIKGKEWARKLTLVWAVYYIIASLVNSWATYTFVSPHLMATLNQQGGGDATATQVGTLIMNASMIIGTVVALTYAILLMVMLSRRKVKAYCKQASA